MSRIYNEAEMEPVYGFFHYLSLVGYDEIGRAHV